MKIVFIGTVEFSKRILARLVRLDIDIAGVLTKKASSFNSDFADLSDICKKRKINYKYVNSINSKVAVDFINKAAPDVIFCFGWSEILGKRLLNIAPLGVIGYHPAMLPQNRGRHPLIWALALGLKATGSTFFFMDKGADSGNILSQRKIKIDYTDNAGTLYEKIVRTAVNQIEEFIPHLKDGSYASIKQDERRASYWRKRYTEDGRIDWKMSSTAIYDLVRALTKPYIGAHFLYKDKEIKVWNATEVKTRSYDNVESGRVIEALTGKHLLIKAGQHCIKIPQDRSNKCIRKGEYL